MASDLIDILALETRPASVPPNILNPFRVHDAESIPRPTSIPPALSEKSSSDPQNSGKLDSLSFDLMAHLNRSIHSVVKTRTGSVLSRGFIMKTDYHPSGRALDMDLNLHGAPNFRAPRVGSLNVFGVAQPRTQGLRAILSVLKARPGLSNPSLVIWFSTREEPVVYISGRPFVLRDASEPRETLAISDRTENLEAIEVRLKKDILTEAARYGGLLLTHNEMATDKGEGPVIPTWTHCDSSNVKTSRELYDGMKEQGWNIEYHRIPISPDRPIEDNYLDAYLQVIKHADPLTTSLVFNCGIGAVRTTFAMVSACLIRRKQIITRGFPDPFATRTPSVSVPFHSGAASRQRTSAPAPPHNESKLAQVMEQANAQQDMNRALLRLTYLLQQCLPARSTHGAIELLMTQTSLLDNLIKAYLGNYSVILSLLGCLDKGIESKRLVDRIIEANDHVTHLREEILMNRLRYSLTTLGNQDDLSYLNKARKALEKYFFVIAFASYVEESSNNFDDPFASWLKARSEIWNQTIYLRRTHGSPLNVFAPVHDLSSLSKSSVQGQESVPGKRNTVEISGGQVLGDEYSRHVIKNRGGVILRDETLLKSDQWLSESQDLENGVRGAINFRQISSSTIYALGQPSLQAVDEVISRVKDANPSATNIVWITLREEPIVYLNGTPYCLRRERFSLRNLKDYGGISTARLEVLEERLKEDILRELRSFDGHILLHSETSDGSIVPVWEEVRSKDVLVFKEIMEAREDDRTIHLTYLRIPVTAERTPDYADLMDLLLIVLRTPTHTPIIVNDQLGGGRSTTTAVLLFLICRWLATHRLNVSSGSKRRRSSLWGDGSEKIVHHRQSYQVINNFLRVIPRGRAVKAIVDDAIDKCGLVLNLRDAIEKARCNAEDAVDDQSKRAHTQKGLNYLRRYFELMVFQAYLQALDPDRAPELETVESFVKKRPVIKTFEKELFAEGLESIKPLERHDVEDGSADPDEVKQVVMNRSGSVLSASTILKSDFFSNLQKMTLPERIDGSPNFRRVPLVLPLGNNSPNMSQQLPMVCGSGMPTLQGLRNALERVDASPTGANTVVWTSLREEPVIYVGGRPHVLRLVDKPLENVEATGVTTSTVEAVEKSFKKDVLHELKTSGMGRILLHDEVEERPGVFSIIPIWETVTAEDILTPRDVFDIVVKEGYKVDYGRVAITDEQAPLPDAISQLYERVKAGFSQNDDSRDFIFNCQMGRGRTTTGMVSASLIATTSALSKSDLEQGDDKLFMDEEMEEMLDQMDGYDESEAYRQGEYKTILQLVGVLSHGRLAKRLTDRAIDVMQDVQNLRKTIYDYKLKVEALERGTSKEKKLRNIAVNYLYRYGALIGFANYLVESRQREHGKTFPEWLVEHREITTLLSRRTLD